MRSSPRSTFHAAYEPQRCVRTNRWKYIRRFGDYPTTVLANCDDSATKELSSSTAGATRSSRRSSSIDLIFDPNEARNLAEDAGHRDVLDAMRGRLDDWMTRTNDPLLAGEVAPPPGAEINLPSQSSSREPREFIPESAPPVRG